MTKNFSRLPPQGHIVLGVDIYTIIRYNPVATLDQFQTCLALPDARIPLNQDPHPINIH